MTSKEPEENDIEREQWSLRLPYDHPKTPNNSSSFKSVVNFKFDNKVIQYLDSREDQENASFLVAGFASLLYRYTGQVMIPVGLSDSEDSEMHDRSLKIRTAGELKFKEIRNAILQDAFNNKDSVNGLDQVFITIREVESNDQIIYGKNKFEIPSSDRKLETLDLHLVILKNHRSTIVGFEYNNRLFHHDTIDRMGRHYENLLISAVDNEEATIAELNLFGDYEGEWKTPFPKGESVEYPIELLHQDIELHARVNADKVAVSSKQESLTYLELNNRANQVAHFILGKGVKPESRIMVCVEPSVDIAVALLAILKTGATYIPINPSHPEYRIRTIIKDTNPELVISHSGIVQFFDFGELPILVLDSSSKELDQLPVNNPDQVIELNQTAYIYYTSGTTGVPKGSLGSYSNLTHYIRVAQKRYGFSSAEIMPALASYTFSISMFELLSPLVAGGTLKILSREDILDTEVMVQALQQATFVHAGPSLLKNLVKYIQRNISDYSAFNSLRHLSSGGDMVPPDLLRNLQLIFQNTELFVIYGCSEIACMGCTYPVDPIRPIEKTYVGKPFNNVALMILDKDGNIPPVGVAGEVCIGGEGVAIGYLNRPELTDERFFVQDNIRFYRTGDVGRLNHEGYLELLGREDFQIQIHGMRVELGEVEYHLRKIPGISDGVVIARRHGAVENTLVAFYVKNEKYQITAESLRAHMTQHVPDYMVPAFYQQLDALPLNVNMKVDRKALLSVELVTTSNGQQPVTKSEKELAELWLELLKSNHIGLYDNFLAIGGDSLLAMEFINQVQDRMGVRLNGLDVLRESLEVLAATCDTQLGRTEKSGSKIGEADILPSHYICQLQSFFFGPEDSLYGLIHPAQKSAKSKAVLICQPIGAEYKRCHFLLKTLADTCADKDVPVMRFDYFGTGDALGESVEASFERWQSDIRSAYQRLIDMTGCNDVIVLAVRLSAMLAVKALAGKKVDQWILWDPVVEGKRHYSKLVEMHNRKVWRSRVIKNLTRPEAINSAEELVGLTYTDQTVAQMKRLKLVGSDFAENRKIKLLQTSINRDDKEEIVELPGLATTLDASCYWYSTDYINTAITDRQISTVLMELIFQ